MKNIFGAYTLYYVCWRKIQIAYFLSIPVLSHYHFFLAVKTPALGYSYIVNKEDYFLLVIKMLMALALFTTCFHPNENVKSNKTHIDPQWSQRGFVLVMGLFVLLLVGITVRQQDKQLFPPMSK